MWRVARSFSLLFVLCVFLVPLASADETGMTLGEFYEKVQAALKHVPVQDYHVKLRERLKPDQLIGEWNTLHIKYRREPYAIYTKFVDGPHKGRESLYVEGKYDNKLICREGWMRFPLRSIAVDPMGSRALAVAHRPITRSGMDYMVRLVADALARMMKSPEEARNHPIIGIEGPTRVTEGGFDCWHVKLYPRKLSWKDYTVQESEKDLFDIEANTKVPAHALLYFNEGLKGYDDVKAGQVLRVPDTGVARFEFWFYADTFFNRRYTIRDWEGRVYEDYIHYDIRVNEAAGLTDEDFDKDNPDYGF